MTDRLPPPLVSAARDVLDTLDAAEIPACLIGAMAVARWGQPRATADADFSVLAPYGDDAHVLDLLLGRFRPRVSDARAFALQHRVLLLQTADGVKLDIALAAFAFEIEAIQQSTPWALDDGVTLRTCSAEDLVVYKLVAARPQDLVDVDGIVRRQGRRLDIDRIRRWGRELSELKADPDLLAPFEAALRRTLADEADT